MTLTERIEAGKPEPRPIRLAPRAKWVERVKARHDAKSPATIGEAARYIYGAYTPDGSGDAA